MVTKCEIHFTHLDREFKKYLHGVRTLTDPLGIQMTHSVGILSENRRSLATTMPDEITIHFMDLPGRMYEQNNDMR